MAPQPTSSSSNPRPQTGPARTNKLLVLLPIIVAGIVGFLVGLANGIAGMIASIAAGLLVSVFFVKKMSGQQALEALQKNLTKIPFIMQIVYMIGTIVFFSIFSVVITKGGLFLPDGIHNPNTLVKYLSIIWVLPENFSKTPTYAFPGYPGLIIAATIIMIVGTIIPERFVDKKIKPIIMMVGLIILTAAPTITHSALGKKGAVPWDYLPVFYLAWVGMIMVMVAVYLPWLLEKLGLSGKGKFPLAAGLLIPFMIPLLPPLHFITGSFEGDHHDAAMVISGWVSALIGMHNASLTGKTTTPEPEAPPAPTPPVDDTTATPPEPIPPGPVVGPSGYKDGTVKTFNNPLGWGDDIELVYDAGKDMWHNTTEDCWYNSLENYQKYQKQAKDDKEWSHKDQNSGHSAFNDKLNEIAQKYKDDFDKSQKAEKEKQQKKDALVDQQMKDHMEGFKASQSANNWDWAVSGASAVETAADTSIDVLAKCTGKQGEIIKKVYTATKDVAKNVSKQVAENGLSAKSVLKGTAKGTGEAIFDLGVDKLKEKVGKMGDGKIPGLYDFKGQDLTKAAKFVPKDITDHVFKEHVIKEGIKDGIKDAIQGKLQGIITDPVKEGIGFKH
jgi:hypothetical protein